MLIWQTNCWDVRCYLFILLDFISPCFIEACHLTQQRIGIRENDIPVWNTPSLHVGRNVEHSQTWSAFKYIELVLCQLPRVLPWKFRKVHTWLMVIEQQLMSWMLYFQYISFHNRINFHLFLNHWNLKRLRVREVNYFVHPSSMRRDIDSVPKSHQIKT